MALRHFRDSSHPMFLVYERKQDVRNCDFNLLIAIVSPENHSQSELAALFSTWKSVHWAVLMSQTWAPVSEEPGYTYHCNCRQRCGPLTPQVSPIWTRLQPAARHPPRTLIHSQYSLKYFHYVFFSVRNSHTNTPPSWSGGPSELNGHFRLDTQSYKQQHTLMERRSRASY